jgi:peptidoglycan/LPS O-acetylase OafA/YrhL
MNNKFIFANQLRGLAAMLVVMTHYFGTFFAEQELLAARTFSPNLHLVPAPWVHLFELEYQGPFGVGIFFLISGFVIPYSLQKTSKAGFLLNRILRIYPTYAVCLGIGTLAILASARYWGQAFSYQPRVLLANAALVHNLLNLPSMDAVNWTLSIEVKFYLLAALGTAAFFSRKPWWQLGFQLFAIWATWYCSDPASWVLWMMELNYIMFMLIGVLFHQHATGLISTRALCWRALLSLAVFSLTWSIGPQRGQFPAVTVWYYLALAVFALSYALRARFRPQRLLDFMADISYPLYCVHSLVGYCLLKVLLQRGLPYGAAVLLTLASAILLAWLVHRTVERGSMQLGRRLAARLARRQPLAAAGTPVA